MNQNSHFTSELMSFKKSISSNNRQAIQKYLSQIKNISEEFLNNSLFWCIQNYKVEEQTDQCLYLLLRYVSESGKIKANPNCQINQQTPLIAACKKGQLSLVRRLIQNGAKPDLTNSKNIHPLEFILFSRQQNYDAAEQLINQMQTVNITVRNSHPILITIEKQYYRIYKILLQKGSDLTFQGFNILHFILKRKFNNVKKKKKFLKELINKHNLFTQKDKFSKIPIEYEQNQQIKTYYQQNFKVKQKQQIQKLSNSSSIFINEKISKKTQKKKNLQQNNSLIISKNKQKQLPKVQTKQSKEQDVSFQEQVDDKSQNAQVQQEDNKQADKNTTNNYHNSNKSPSIYNQAINSNITKKNTKTNSSFTNSGPNNISSLNISNLNLNNSLTIVSTNKYKLKYSNIPSKTQTNLRNTNKKVNNYQNKKYNNLNLTNYGMNKSRKDEQKKQEIIVVKQNVNYNKQIKIIDQCVSPIKLKKSSENLKEKHQSPQKQNQKQKSHLQQKLLNRKSNQLLSISIQISEDLKLPQKTEQFKVDFEQKSVSQRLMQECQKIFGELVIKDDQQATNLTVLKAKFNQVFQDYKNSIQKKHTQSNQKLKQLKLSNNVENTQNQSHLKSISNKELINNCQNHLTQQILKIEKSIQKNSLKINQMIAETINLIKNKVQFALQASRKQKIQVQIEMYGSRANGLQIQHSDIDLLIVCNIQNAGVKDLMNQLQKSGIFICKQINEIKFLTNTSMPIVKLSLNEQFAHLDIDLTFQIRGHTGIRCTSLVKQFITAEPLLKPLVVALKTLLNYYNLCDTYTGGLGSYSLTLMSIALLQFTEIQKTKQNLGQILLQFLLFYGFQLDYVWQAIIIHPPGFNEKPAFSIYQLPYSLDLTPKLIIYDPLNPVNNVGRATYRIVQLKKLFKIWYIKLKTEFSINKNGLEELMNISKELLNCTSCCNEIKKN